VLDLNVPYYAKVYISGWVKKGLLTINPPGTMVWDMTDDEALNLARALFIEGDDRPIQGTTQ
jgi:hypothetical protein